MKNIKDYSTLEKVEMLIATSKQLKTTIQKRDKIVITQSQTSPSPRNGNSRGGKLTSLWANSSRCNDLIETLKEHIKLISNNL